MRRLALVGFAVGLRLFWVGLVPTRPQGDGMMYFSAAEHLATHGHLDGSYIAGPGIVLVLAGAMRLGGGLLAAKLVGVAFAGLGTAALHAVSERLVGARAAMAAALLYAVWPAGISAASVIGSDVPATALLLSALWLLVAQGSTRPTVGALGFGALVGVASCFRGVVLPLAALPIFWWLAARVPLRRVVVLGAGAACAAIVMLSPWIARNRLRYGELLFTDSHGGITALLGAYPNTDGVLHSEVYELHRLVHGQSIFEDHRGGDRAAYALAVRWSQFEPAYAAALVAKKAVRLFGPEWELMSWSLLGAFDSDDQTQTPHVAERLRAIAPAAANLADGFWIGVAVSFAFGLAFAFVDGLWSPVALLVPAQLALTAAHALYFGNPRYHIPIEALGLPFSGYAIVRAAEVRVFPLRRAHVLAAVVALVLVFSAFWGAANMAKRILSCHRWSALVCSVAGIPRACMIKRVKGGGRPSPLAPVPGLLAVDLTSGPVTLELSIIDARPGPYWLTAEAEVPAGAMVDVSGNVAPGGGVHLDAERSEFRVPIELGPMGREISAPLRLASPEERGAELRLSDLRIDPR